MAGRGTDTSGQGSRLASGGGIQIIGPSGTVGRIDRHCAAGPGARRSGQSSLPPLEDDLMRLSVRPHRPLDGTPGRRGRGHHGARHPTIGRNRSGRCRLPDGKRLLGTTTSDQQREVITAAALRVGAGEEMKAEARRMIGPRWSAPRPIPGGAERPRSTTGAAPRGAYATVPGWTDTVTDAEATPSGQIVRR